LNGEEELTSILSKYPFLVNWINSKEKTPLYFAIEGNHLSTCELLLDFGADIFFFFANLEKFALFSFSFVTF